LDATGRITFVNDRVHAVAGVSPGDVRGLLLRDLAVDHDRAAVDLHLRALRSGAPQVTFPMRTLSDAGVRHFEVSLAAMREGEGFQGIAQDVTERHQLAREMTERTRELRTTREEQERLRAFVSLVIQAQEDERARIAGDLHDTTVQTLTAIGRRLKTLAETAGQDLAGHHAELSALGAAAMAEAEEVRRLSRNLRPSVLDHLGISAALRNLAAELEGHGVAVSLREVGNAAALGDATRTALFRIAQESVTNIRRHSGATAVDLELRVGPREVRLAVSDNGTGFDAPAEGGPGDSRSSRLGLAGMRERALMLGGRVTIESAPGHGTRVTAALPLAQGSSPLGPAEPATG
jgi:PAS domain S-box-containing protein